MSITNNRIPQQDEDILLSELNKLLEEYKNRLKEGLGHKQLSSHAIASMIGSGVATGTAIGTVIPGVGNAVGAAAGAALAAGVVAIIKLQNDRNNKKKDNTSKIKAYLLEDEHSDQKTLKDAASQVIHERSKLLKKLSYGDRESVAKYLAANMMSALKHHDHKNGESPVGVMVAGVRDIRSKKVPSRQILANDGVKITLEEIAKYRRSL